MSRKNKRNRNRSSSSTIPSTARVDSLIAASNWKEGATAAQALLSVSPSDHLRRQLARCLHLLGDMGAEVNVLRSIEVKLYDDRFKLGCALCLLKEWMSAKSELENCLKERETAATCYWLALATAQGKRYYYEIRDNREAVNGLLTKARQLRTRLPEVYLWLVDLIPYDRRSESDESEQILLDGLSVCPDDWELREALAKDLLRRDGRLQDASEVLKPILSSERPTLSSLWLAKDIAERQEQWQEAIFYLDKALPYLDKPSDSLGIRTLRGNLCLSLGRIDDAIDDFRQELGKPDPEAKAVSHLALALAFARQEKFPQAVAYAQNAVNAWMEATAGIIAFHPELFLKCDEGQVRDTLPIYADDVAYLLAGHSEDEFLIQALRYWHANSWCGGLDYQLDVARNLSPDQLFATHREWAILASREGDIVRALNHHLAFIESIHNSDRLDYLSWTAFFEDEGFEYDKCLKNKPKVKSKVNDLLLQFTLKNKANSKLIELAILPLYREVWRKLLFETQDWRTLYEVCICLVSSTKDAYSLFFDYAYAADAVGEAGDAEAAYRVLIDRNPKDSASLHNLSIIVEKRSLDEALELQRLASQANPNDELTSKRLARLEQEAEQKRLDAQRLDDFLRTARDRWPQLDYYKKKLLGTLRSISGFDDWDHLARLAGTEEKYLRGHWRKLVDEGFIIGEPENYKLNEHVSDLIDRERSHAVAVTMVRADSTIAYKPIFNSKKEYEVYNVLIGLFPNHLVFPNMSLHAIFQYERMKELLDSNDFGYYLRQQVDFCITSTANYLPIIGIEVDSDFHDDPAQIERDEVKNRIFERGGVSLLRLRSFGRPPEAGLRQEIVKIVQELGNELRATTHKSEELNRLTLEINFDTFGTDGKKPLLTF